MEIEKFAYLAVLVTSLVGLGIIDKRFELAIFRNATRALKTLAAGIGFFIIWDLAGVYMRIFRVGESTFITGIRLWHEFPLEELFFLALLVYTALLAYRGGEKLWPRT